MEKATVLKSTREPTRLHQCAERIIARVDKWLAQNGEFVPMDTKRRRENARSWRHLARAMLGLLSPVFMPDSRRLILFEGLRDRRYHRHFDPKEVVIVGSHPERKYAQDNGYAFVWSYAIEGAIRVALSRGLRLFLLLQLRKWARLLEAYDSVGIFIYEDTQPLGAYFAHVAELSDGHVTVACIQHGYFPKPVNDLPIDGSASQFNFVWDQAQAHLIGCPPHRTFVIGPPVCDIAKATMQPDVVLVGTGTYYDGSDDYRITLDWYTSLRGRLPENLRQRVYYRPHPNEMLDPAIATRIRGQFPTLDLLPLSERLTGGVAVFVGSHSSLLFEAAYAGHRVVHVRLREDGIALFPRSAEFSRDQIADAAEWIEAACGGCGEVHPTPPPRPQVDFPTAAQAVLLTSKRTASVTGDRRQ